MWRILIGLILVIGLTIVVAKALKHFSERASIRQPSIRVTFPKIP
jgi:hypothetical protein